MQEHQREFLNFALALNVLRFGEFKLKSGRMSPYFFNSGLFNRGADIARLGGYYAQALLMSKIEFDMLYGPAYKGIPLVTALAIALATQHGRDVPYCFNRKEAKDHAEGGLLVGAPLQGRVIIVDDVISAGTSVAESVAIIRAASAEAVGVVIALDRQERGTTQARSAVQEAQERYNLKVIPIVGLDTLQHFLAERAEFSAHRAALEAYQARYGI